jgi:hypothetical protein
MGGSRRGFLRAWCARHATRASCDYRYLTQCWLAGGNALDAPLNEFKELEIVVLRHELAVVRHRLRVLTSALVPGRS